MKVKALFFGLSLPFLISVLNSCTEKTVNKEIVTVHSTNDAGLSCDTLKNQLDAKDTLIQHLISDFAQIQNNLTEIRARQEKMKNDALLHGVKPSSKKVKKELEAIEKLINENKAIAKRLEVDLKKSQSGKEMMYQEFMTTLNQMSDDQAQEASLLFHQLDSLANEHIKLKIKYGDAMDEIAQKQKLLNTAYYTAGTAKELLKKKVITTQGGFAGVGKTTKLSEKFNTENFSEVDITTLKQIKLKGSKIKLITVHPKDSYSIISNGGETIVIIGKPSLFWSASKYMVALIEK